MMNTVRKSENLLPFPVISAAANGDTTAMCAILKHYEGYIAKLCTRQDVPCGIRLHKPIG